MAIRHRKLNACGLLLTPGCGHRGRKLTKQGPISGPLFFLRFQTVGHSLAYGVRSCTSLKSGALSGLGVKKKKMAKHMKMQANLRLLKVDRLSRKEYMFTAEDGDELRYGTIMVPKGTKTLKIKHPGGRVIIRL